MLLCNWEAEGSTQAAGPGSDPGSGPDLDQ